MIANDNADWYACTCARTANDNREPRPQKCRVCGRPAVPGCVRCNKHRIQAIRTPMRPMREQVKP